MNYLYQKIISLFGEISIISLTFLLVFQIPVLAQSGEIINTLENRYVYKIQGGDNLSIVGVAIATNIGMRHSKIQQLPVTIYKDVFTIEQILISDNTLGDDFISKNMLLLKEYRNISSTNIQSLLDQSYDKPATLKSYLDTLKNRYDLANKQIISLTRQKEVFESTMSQTQEQIETLKTKIESDFSGVKTQETIKNINTYLELKDKFNTARTYTIFIQRFLEQYQFLNQYNSEVANILLKNSEAIIKDAYIVIPESGNTQLLEELKLIIEE